MKKLIMSLSIAFAFIISMFSFAACKKSSPTELDVWVGTWKFAGMESYKNGVFEGSMSLEDILEEAGSEGIEDNETFIAMTDAYLTLQKDGTYKTNFIEGLGYDSGSSNATTTDFMYHDLFWAYSGDNLILNGYATWTVIDTDGVTYMAESVNSLFSCSYSSMILDRNTNQIRVSLTFERVDASTQEINISQTVIILGKK